MWKFTFMALGLLALVALVVGPRRRQEIKRRLYFAAVVTLLISLALRTGRYLLDRHASNAPDNAAKSQLPP
jgi:hypothetical protein